MYLRMNALTRWILFREMEEMQRRMSSLFDKTHRNSIEPFLDDPNRALHQPASSHPRAMIHGPPLRESCSGLRSATVRAAPCGGIGPPRASRNSHHPSPSDFTGGERIGTRGVGAARRLSPSPANRRFRVCCWQGAQLKLLVDNCRRRWPGKRTIA